MQTPPSMPTAPGLDSLFSMFRSNPGVSILAVCAFILIFIVIFKMSDIMSYFKDRAVKKEELEIKKIDLETKKAEQDNERHENTIIALNNVAKVVENNNLAINSIEKTILMSEARSNEKFSDIKNQILGVESRLSDKIASSAEKAVQASKLDKIAAGLIEARGSKPSFDKCGGEDSCHGDHS